MTRKAQNVKVRCNRKTKSLIGASLILNATGTHFKLTK